ncbi:GyrI-like domain-containing protein [Marinomonas posidonica]|uniref:Transcription activator effector binding protein n=1 Tax=Marinomonas posidonica (strain CECT 7376 / NCIMB 14433 / IVIA-Po-181) TaxID=491952 RepID=F6CUD2_MARPP|nr:effector binding domain-containing protein [Marinomonas posidonica]AEF55251.1 transcription activator effector binding protein [Marinomonas posidonica IVIA-Po-181]
MDVSVIEEMAVRGIGVRTRNVDEMQPETAKIGDLWGRFYSQLMPKLSSNAQVFGLYTHYESDHNGWFDVVACTDSLAQGDVAEVKDYSIVAGSYLVFRGSGEMPKAVIDLWGEVWRYFSSDHCAYKRAFTTDFECYKSDREIEIYIAIE